MPEGDTIHRAAARLRAALDGATVAAFRAPRLVQPGPGAGTVIDGVEARGKYLLVHFADGWTLETHMRMTGSWHLYRTGERWRRSAAAARAVIETESGWVAVCFAAPEVRLVRRNGGETGHLGPDLCTAAPDLALAVRRFDLLPSEALVADALLDQRVCCGVGNVYKSEVLFACGVHPLAPVGGIDGAGRLELVTTAHRLLRRNLGPGGRVTVDGVRGGLAVYNRRDRPCIRCGQAVAYAKVGRHRRGTYWCPACQPAPDAPPPGQRTM